MKTIPVPFYKDIGSPVAVESVSRRLFFPAGKDLVVINADTGQTVGKIRKIGHVSDVAFAPGLNRGFAVGKTGGFLVIFDLKKICHAPEDPCRRQDVFVLDAHSQMVSVLHESSPSALALTGAVPLSLLFDLVFDEPRHEFFGLTCDFGGSKSLTMRVGTTTYKNVDVKVRIPGSFRLVVYGEN